MKKSITRESYAWVLVRVIDNTPDIYIKQRVRNGNGFLRVGTDSCSGSPETTWYRFGKLRDIAGRYSELLRQVNLLIPPGRFDDIDFA